MFYKKCKIPVQLVRHTALQLPLPLYEFIPTLTRWQPLQASCLFLFDTRTPFGCCLEEQAFLLEHPLEDFI